MTAIDKLNLIISSLEEARADAEKVDAGKTGAPGTRVRKAAQSAKTALNELRGLVLAQRAEGSEE